MFATLLKPKTLRIGSILFKQNVPEPVSEELYERLSQNPRFHVSGQDPKVTGEKVGKARSKSEERALIKDAVAGMDRNERALWGRDGYPTAEAVSNILGFEVEDRDIRNALPKLADQRPTSRTKGDLTTGDVNPAPKPAKAKIKTQRDIAVEGAIGAAEGRALQQHSDENLGTGAENAAAADAAANPVAPPAAPVAAKKGGIKIPRKPAAVDPTTAGAIES